MSPSGIGAVKLLMRFSLVSLDVLWMVLWSFGQGSFLLLVYIVTRQWSNRYSDVLQFDAFRSELTSVKIKSRILP